MTGVKQRTVEVRCPITGKTEKMGLGFLWVDGEVIRVEHNFCDQYHLCKTCEKCGEDVRAFFKENPNWTDIRPYAALRSSPKEHE